MQARHNRPLLPCGTPYYALSTCHDYYGNQLAYRVNTFTMGYGSLPDNQQYQTAWGVVKVRYFLTEEQLKEALFPTPKPKKKHRLAKAMILSIAALSGMMDEKQVNMCLD